MEYMTRRDPITGFYETVPVPEDCEELNEETVAEPVEDVIQSPKKVGRPRGVKNAANRSRAVD